MFTGRSRMLSKRMCLVLLGLMVPFLLFLAGCATTTDRQSIGDEYYDDDVHYLSAYGGWIDYPPYGMVWQPHVVSGWGPFYYGHWIWTGDGWAWTSYEPYGWLVYHYGYWGYEPGFGWFWIRGDTWLPACVQWYTFGSYAAWAPLPPPSVVWPDPWDPYDVDVWIVVDIDNFANEDVGRHRIARPVYRESIQQRTIVKRPPDIRVVERVTRRTVPTVRIREQETRIRPRTDSKPPATVRRREPALKRMVLPKAEKRKVERHGSKVEREVLVPRKKPQEQKKRSPDRSTDRKRERK